MLENRIRDHVAPVLRPGEEIRAAMAGFRPISRSFALLAIFPIVFLGFAIATATGWPAWIGGGVGGGLGAGVAAWLDQRRARTEHGGKGMSIGLAVTDRRLFVLDLDTGFVAAHVAGTHLEAERGDISSIETERMQGSGIKRPGVVLVLRDGTVERLIPARIDPFVKALAD